MYNASMIIGFDYILQIVAISTSFGGIITLGFLHLSVRNRITLFGLLMLLANTTNYFMGIIAYTLPIEEIPTIYYNIFTGFQFISALLIIETTRLFIESLGTVRLQWIKVLSRIFYLFPFTLFFLLKFSSESILTSISDISILLLGVLLWIDLFTVDTQNKMSRKVRMTALVGYGIIIQGYLLQSALPTFFSISLMEPLSFLFLSFSSLFFSIFFLIHKSERIHDPNKEENLQLSYGLTNRELEVLNLLIKSSSYKDIADSLGISMATVKTHVSRVYKKTKTKGRSEVKYRFSPKK